MIPGGEADEMPYLPDQLLHRLLPPLPPEPALGNAPALLEELRPWTRISTMHQLHGVLESMRAPCLSTTKRCIAGVGDWESCAWEWEGRGRARCEQRMGRASPAASSVTSGGSSAARAGGDEWGARFLSSSCASGGVDDDGRKPCGRRTVERVMVNFFLHIYSSSD